MHNLKILQILFYRLYSIFNDHVVSRVSWHRQTEGDLTEIRWLTDTDAQSQHYRPSLRREEGWLCIGPIGSHWSGQKQCEFNYFPLGLLNVPNHFLTVCALCPPSDAPQVILDWKRGDRYPCTGFKVEPVRLRRRSVVQVSKIVLPRHWKVYVPGISIYGQNMVRL